MMKLSDFTIRDSDSRKKIIGIIFEDEDLIVVDKPSGLPVIPDRWNTSKPNLFDIINLKLQEVTKLQDARLWIVHRIDEDTSGIVLFAKNATIHRKLNGAFEKKIIRKTYLAIVKGTPASDTGKIEFPLSPPKHGKVSIDPNGKPAVTRFQVLEKFKRFSLLEVYPETGRTHQIRVHLKAIGNSLAVDPVYSRFSRLGIEHLKRIRSMEGEHEVSLISRLTLHAYKLEINTPNIKKKYSFTANIPKDMMAAVKALRKWDSLR
jgi:23S rRNA pseudouridine955/2504/2580 synthase/23S rRNA pseudouridine1911/1915/1917 synthase